MNLHVDAIQGNKGQAVANNMPKQQGNGESELQEMVNDSPQVSQLRIYQQMANNSPQVKQLRAYQQMADTAVIQNKPVVQRAVIMVSKDHLINDSAQTVANVTNATAGAFSEVRNDETIYIFAHGYHSLTMPLDKNGKSNLEPMLEGGITAARLCEMMIIEGWKKEHTGAIDIRACMSGAESMLPNFAQLFAAELKKAGRTNIVTGYKHLTKTENDGTETAMKPTIIKMIDVAQQFDPDDLSQQLFAINVTEMYETRIGGLLKEREKYDLMGNKFGAEYIVGQPLPQWGMTIEEWNVYSFYHAVGENNALLISALNKDFSKRRDKLDKAVRGSHARQFDPANM